MRYAVVIEKVGKRYSAHVPDLPGCVAAGASVASVKAALAEVSYSPVFGQFSV
jgi:predicted RNase H-like HicB family nuclease